MSLTDENQYANLADQIRDALAATDEELDGSIVTAYIVIAEVSPPTGGGRWLTTRAALADGTMLPSWTRIGMLDSAMTTTRQWAHAEVDDDEGDES